MEDVKELASDHPLLCKVSPIKVRDEIRSFYKDEESLLPLHVLPSETPQQRLTRIGIKNTCTEANQTKSDDGSESEYTCTCTPSLVSPSTCLSRKSSQKLFKDDEYEVLIKLLDRDQNCAT